MDDDDDDCESPGSLQGKMRAASPRFAHVKTLPPPLFEGPMSVGGTLQWFERDLSDFFLNEHTPLPEVFRNKTCCPWNDDLPTRIWWVGGLEKFGTSFFFHILKNVIIPTDGRMLLNRSSPSFDPRCDLGLERLDLLGKVFAQWFTVFLVYACGLTWRFPGDFNGI